MIIMSNFQPFLAASQDKSAPLLGFLEEARATAEPAECWTAMHAGGMLDGNARGIRLTW